MVVGFRNMRDYLKPPLKPLNSFTSLQQSVQPIVLVVSKIAFPGILIPSTLHGKGHQRFRGFQERDCGVRVTNISSEYRIHCYSPVYAYNGVLMCLHCSRGDSKGAGSAEEIRRSTSSAPSGPRDISSRMSWKKGQPLQLHTWMPRQPSESSHTWSQVPVVVNYHLAVSECS